MTKRFYLDMPVQGDFAALVDTRHYAALPGDWMIGITDVVASTAAIAAGKYKTVNMAGASAVAALMNALESMIIPFVFGGDGASFAVHADHGPVAGEALARTAAFVRDEFGLDLRVALVPVADVRAAGHDVRIARFGPSPDVSYAMFRGGGLAWATDQMKAGRYLIPASPVGYRPDLSGLSCRFDALKAHHDLMLSLVVVPVAGETAAFEDIVQQVLALLDDPAQARRPFGTPADLSLHWPAEGLDMEIRTNHVEGYPRWLIRLERLIFTRFATFLMNGDRRAGRFDAKRYKNQLVANADYRKYDDGLRITLDCTSACAERLEALLQKAEAAGIIRFGLHRQDAAIMTCFVPSPSEANHIHFIDGAAGGYAAAAQKLKSHNA